MEGLFAKLSSFILYINLQSVYSVLFDAIISAYISYRFTKWRENQRLKIDNSLGKINNDFKIIQINQTKENAINNFEEYSEIWISYSKSFMYIISILESREVILNKFVKDKFELIDEFPKLVDLQNNFTTLYYNDISNKMILNQLINTSSLKKVDDYQQKFIE